MCFVRVPANLKALALALARQVHQHEQMFACEQACCRWWPATATTRSGFIRGVQAGCRIGWNFEFEMLQYPQQRAWRDIRNHTDDGIIDRKLSGLTRLANKLVTNFQDDDELAKMPRSRIW